MHELQHVTVGALEGRGERDVGEGVVSTIPPDLVLGLLPEQAQLLLELSNLPPQLIMIDRSVQ